MNRVTGTSIGSATTLAAMQLDFVIEDGSGLSSANTYVGVEEANSLLADHQDYNLVWSNLTVAQQQQALLAGTIWLDDKFRFYGQTLTTSQSLQWPRTKNYDRKGAIIAPGTIPWQLKKSTSYAAVKWAKDVGLFNEVPAQGQVRSFSEEGASITFDPKESAGWLLQGVRLPEVELLLKSVGEFRTADTWAIKETEERF